MADPPRPLAFSTVSDAGGGVRGDCGSGAESVRVQIVVVTVARCPDCSLVRRGVQGH